MGKPVQRNKQERDLLISKARELRAEGVTVREISEQLGLSKHTINGWIYKAAPQPARQVVHTTELNGAQQLRVENERLKELVAQLSLDKLTLQQYIQRHSS